MKKVIIILGLLGVLFANFLNAQNLQKPNYITSGYYQLIYEADTAYLVGNYEYAYKKIQEAETKMPLIEQPNYYEISNYIELLIEHLNYKKALHYIEILVKNYGYPIEKFENKDYFTNLQQNTNWDKLKKQLSKLYEKFYKKVDKNLLNTLIEMCENDQKVRNEEDSDTKWQHLNEVDSINTLKMKEIFKNYGFPNAKMLGYSNYEPNELYSRIKVMLMHFIEIQDTAYFKPVLLKFIEKGECAPQVLGSYVDSRDRFNMEKQKYTYGTYYNTRDQIKDFENLDERRKAIGMPPFEIDLKINAIFNLDSIMKADYGIQIEEDN